MLVLSRSVGELVVMVLPDGRQVTVKVVEVRHTGKIRLGITAPEDVPVHRQEIQKIVEAKR